MWLRPPPSVLSGVGVWRGGFSSGTPGMWGNTGGSARFSVGANNGCPSSVTKLWCCAAAEGTLVVCGAWVADGAPDDYQGQLVAEGKMQKPHLSPPLD